MAGTCSDSSTVLHETLLQIQALEDFGKTLTDENLHLLKYIKVMEEYVYTTKTDLQGIITYVSDSFCRLSGYERDELIGYTHNIVRHPENPERFYADLWDMISQNRIWEGEVRNLRKDGSDFWMETIIFPIHDDARNVIGYSSIRHNITDNKCLQKQLIRDTLTGTFNRRHYDVILEQELLQTRREHTSVTYVMMDIDNFKLYNDLYGHRKGDEVLVQIGALLQSIEKDGHFAFRMGGEEFSLFLIGLSKEAAYYYIEVLRSEFEGLSIRHDNNTAAEVVTVSMGMVYIDTEHTIVDENALYSAADNALYKAKETGRNRVCIHEIGDVEMFATENR